MKLIQSVSQVKELPIQSKKTIEFKIGDAGKIIDILRSKIYSHPIRTLVQEYLTNARDAVREVDGGKIVVSLPNSEDLELRIRDFGPGISKDRMMNYFVQYGNTTKSDSNKQTGGFGLGSKLGWAYSDVFTIITYVDGHEYHYEAHIGKNRNGTLELISDKKSSEKNGTEIRISVKEDDVSEFTQAFYRATFFWNEKPVLSNREYPLEGWTSPEAVKLSKVIHLYSAHDVTGIFTSSERYNRDSAKIIVAIDGIPYPLSHEFIQSNEKLEELENLLAAGSVVVLHVSNGLIEIAASRETISENERTYKVIAAKVEDAIQEIERWSKSLLKGSKSLSQLIDNFKTIRKYLCNRSVEIEIKGEKFKLMESYNSGQIGITSDQIEKLEIIRFNDSRRKISKHGSESTIYLGVPVIVADESISVAKQNAKVKLVGACATLISKGSQTQKYLLALGEQLSGRVLSEIALPKVLREVVSAPEGSIKASQFVVSDDSYSQGYYSGRSRKTVNDVTIDLKTNEKQFVYLNNEQAAKKSIYGSLTQILKQDEVRLIVLSQKGIKTVESNPSFVSLDAFLAKPESVLSKGTLKHAVQRAKDHVLSGCEGDLSFLVSKSELLSKVQDKKLRSSLKVLAGNVYKGRELRSHMSFSREDDFLLAHLFKTHPFLKALQKLAKELPAYISKSYPLLPFISTYSMKNEKQARLEVIAYLNGKHAA